MMTAVGANSRSSTKYLRNMGDKEKESEAIWRAMVTQSEQALFALAEGEPPSAPTVKILEYKEMEPFFVAGDSDARR